MDFQIVHSFLYEHFVFKWGTLQLDSSKKKKKSASEVLWIVVLILISFTSVDIFSKLSESQISHFASNSMFFPVWDLPTCGLALYSKGIKVQDEWKTSWIIAVKVSAAKSQAKFFFYYYYLSGQPWFAYARWILFFFFFHSLPSITEVPVYWRQLTHL